MRTPKVFYGGTLKQLMKQTSLRRGLSLGAYALMLGFIVIAWIACSRYAIDIVSVLPNPRHPIEDRLYNFLRFIHPFFAWSLFLAGVYFPVMIAARNWINAKLKTGILRPSVPQNDKLWFKGGLTPFLFYCLATLVFFYPQLADLSNSLIGPPEDNCMHYWSLDWDARALGSPAVGMEFSNMIFHPEGSSLLFHTHSFFNVFLNALLVKVMSPVLSYNLLILQTFPLAALGAFFLIRYLTGDPFASLAGGFIYGFNPSHYAHALHHINIATIQFLPFFILFYLKAIQKPTLRNIFAATLFFLLNSLCDWQYLIFAVLFMALVTVYLMIRRRTVWMPQIYAVSLVIAGVPVLVQAGWLAAMARTMKGHYAEVALPLCQMADLFGLVVPHINHWLGNFSWIGRINRLYLSNEWEGTVYLGLVNLGLVFLAWRLIKTQAKKYLAGLVHFAVLALGSPLTVLGHEFPLKLPFALLAQIPLMSLLRAPSRLIVFSYLFLGILTALALKELLGRIRSPRAFAVTFLAILGLIFADYYSVSDARTPVAPPPCFAALPRSGDPYAILILPSDGGVDKYYLMHQVAHGLPMVNGALARKIGKTLIDSLEMEDLLVQEARLLDARVRYIVFYKNFLAEDAPLVLDRYKAHYPAFFEDDENLVLKVY